MILTRSPSFNLPASPRQIALKFGFPPPRSFHGNIHFDRRKCGAVRCCSASRQKSGRGKKVGRTEEGGDEEEEEKGERKVHCEVEVISWRERRIKGGIRVDADVESLWNAVTDYERLADFIPNLVCSGRIPCPHPDRIWLEQRGLQRALYWHIEARVVLDLQEFLHSPDNRELRFSMVDGDFKKFDGKWTINSGTRPGTAILSYEVNVIPRFNLPAILLERIIRSDLPVNLRALACRAEREFKESRMIEITENGIRMATYTSPERVLDGASCATNLLSTEDLKEKYSGSNFGPMPHSSELNSNWGVLGKVCRLDKQRCMVDEVHLRRFDGLLENGGVHRCVVASITVKAPVREVWNVLTAYESLPEIVPNLAICKVLSRENNKVRILQEGCKGLLYMVLHARVVLDLCERLEQEISFEQVEGDFNSFQGKWLLEQLGSHHTLLKYNVESKMHKDSFLSEAIMEEVIYEDLPSNLCAVRDYIEKREAINSSETRDQLRQDQYERDLSTVNSDPEHCGTVDQDVDASCSVSHKQRPRVPGLQRDIEILKSELLKFISEHGQEGFMPMRKQLRLYGRVDIEKAITRMGGFRRIATLMNLSLAYKHRKPKGYWDNLENLEEEISRFQRSWGMDPSFMPSRKSFERAGRYDIARALEKWGGLHEVSRLLALKVRRPNRQVTNNNNNTSKEKRVVDSVAATSNTESTEAIKILSKPCLSQDTQKWVMKLKDLDINWVD